MTWVLILGLAALALLGAALVFRVPAGGGYALGAALMLGVFGYALQGHPDWPGSPTPPRQATRTADGANEVEARREMSSASGLGNRWLVIADAMARNGDYGGAAEVLRGAVTKDPSDADAWLAMAMALVSHADRQLSPAALYAFRRAEAAAPENPGPPLFLGLALAQSGRLAEGRQVWADLLARSPEDAPWRAGLIERLAELDAFIADRDAAARTAPR
jgi:cytochrome c-type biogenesis protein CcmH